MAEAVPLAMGFPASFGSAVLEVSAPPESTNAPLKPAGTQTQRLHPLPSFNEIYLCSDKYLPRKRSLLNSKASIPANIQLRSSPEPSNHPCCSLQGLVQGCTRAEPAQLVQTQESLSLEREQQSDPHL